MYARRQSDCHYPHRKEQEVAEPQELVEQSLTRFIGRVKSYSRANSTLHLIILGEKTATKTKVKRVESEHFQKVTGLLPSRSSPSKGEQLSRRNLRKITVLT